MEITGKITYISEIEKVGAKKMPKRTITIEEIIGQFPNSINLDAFGNKHNILASNRIELGDIIKAHFNYKRKEYNGKYYNSMTVYKVEKLTVDVEDDERFGPGVLAQKFLFF